LGGCFNRISIKATMDGLREMCFPEEFVEYLIRYLTMIPETNWEEPQKE